MKNLLVCLIVLLLNGCLENDMEKASELWSHVTASENAASEAENIKAVRQLIADKHMTIVVNVKNTEGKIVNINALPDNEAFSSVQITFETEKGEYKAPEWIPKDKENIYLLFLE